jgi:hypothetical protein
VYTNHQAGAPLTTFSRPPNLSNVSPPILSMPRNEHAQMWPRTAQPTASAPATRSATTTTQTLAPTRPAATLMPAQHSWVLIQPHSAAKNKVHLYARAYPGHHRDLQSLLRTKGRHPSGSGAHKSSFHSHSETPANQMSETVDLYSKQDRTIGYGTIQTQDYETRTYTSSAMQRSSSIQAHWNSSSGKTCLQLSKTPPQS